MVPHRNILGFRTVQQNPDPKKLINQAHHFAAFFILGLQNPQQARLESFLLDGAIPFADNYNPHDLALSELAIQLGETTKKGEISWQDIAAKIYESIKSF